MTFLNCRIWLNNKCKSFELFQIFQIIIKIRGCVIILENFIKISIQHLKQFFSYPRLLPPTGSRDVEHMGGLASVREQENKAVTLQEYQDKAWQPILLQRQETEKTEDRTRVTWSPQHWPRVTWSQTET